MTIIACFVATPVAAFRNPRSREYLETLPVPPPATIYGMFCSAVGEPDRLEHAGAQLALGIIARGTRSRVLRTSWRVKDAAAPLGIGENKRPDYQELLIDVRLVVHLSSGDSERRPTLAERVEEVLNSPGSIDRFGGLSLGESTHLVDELRRVRPSDLPQPNGLEWLVEDADGALALPVWVDHVGSRNTVYRQFALQSGRDVFVPPGEAWVTISPRSG